MRPIFIGILLLAAIVVGASLLISTRTSTPESASFTVDRPDAVTIRVLTALPVEPWVRSAAEQFNNDDNLVDGVPVNVEIVAADGLTALGRWDRNEYGALPADTLPDAGTARVARRVHRRRPRRCLR